MPEVSTPMDDFVEMMDGQAKLTLMHILPCLMNFLGYAD